MQAMSENSLNDQLINPLLINEMENNKLEKEENLELSEPDLDVNETSNNENGTETEEKKVFKKIEKKLKKENSRLSNQLLETQQQLKEFQQLFTTTFENAYQDNAQPAYTEPEDEIAQKVSAALKKEKDAELQRKQEEHKKFLEECDARLTKQLDEKLAELSEEDEKFDDTVRSFVKEINPTQQQEIVNVCKIIPNGADVFYSLAKNPAEVKRIFSMDPYSRLQAFAQYMLDVDKNASKARVVSNAPKPLGNVNIKGNPNFSTDYNTISIRDLKASLKQKSKQR